MTNLNDDAVHVIANAIRAISHGNETGPTGIEMLSIAISGPRPQGEPTLGTYIQDGLGEIAAAIREGLDDIADAIRDASPSGPAS